MARTETLTIGGSPMEVYVDQPSGTGPHPGIVVTHHRGALDAFTRKFVEDLAAAGYVAAAPLLYHRRPKDEESQVSLANLNDAEIIADIGATVDYLKQQSNVRADALGIVGHCMGGRCSFLGAATNPSFRACAIFYGGNIFKAWGEGNPVLIERAGGIKCPVIGFFGKDDQNPSPDDVKKIDAELARHGVPHTFHSYDGAGHAFQNFLNEAGYREEATRDAQAKLLDFFKAELEPVAA
jgi:carboxymethylenebutenolidase